MLAYIFIPFERAVQSISISLSSHRIDDTNLLRAVDNAGDAVPILFLWGNIFKKRTGKRLIKKVSDILTENNININICEFNAHIPSFALKVNMPFHFMHVIIMSFNTV